MFDEDMAESAGCGYGGELREEVTFEKFQFWDNPAASGDAT
jgi:hypothetical protein